MKVLTANGDDLTVTDDRRIIMMKNGDSINLLDFGVDGLVRHTGGHTIAFTGRAIRPPFEDDPQTVASELTRMVESGAKRFYMGHGGPLEAAEVMRHARSLSKIAASPCASGRCDHKSH